MGGKRLANQRSPRWAFMERFEIPNLDDPTELYLTRLRIIQTPWFGIYLHRMDGPDSRPTLHDHPWPFVSLVLRGGYEEDRLNPHTLERFPRTVRWVNRMPAYGAHAIRSLLRQPTWTLLLVGRRVRTWGYWEPRGIPGTWVWTEYDKHEHSREFDKAMQMRRDLGLSK